MTKRPSNQELCADFRALLTEGFYIAGDMACSDLLDDTQQRDEVLRVTKPWRNEVWKAFRELEDRLCPLEALAREKEQNGT